jgi:hypothetical protein
MARFPRAFGMLMASGRHCFIAILRKAGTSNVPELIERFQMNVQLLFLHGPRARDCSFLDGPILIRI